MTSTSTASIAIATRFRRSRRRASDHGLAPAAAVAATCAETSAAARPSLMSGYGIPRELLLHPGLVDQPVELLAEDEVPDPLRHEVDVVRVEQRRHRRRVGHLPVDLLPEEVRRV